MEQILQYNTEVKLWEANADGFAKPSTLCNYFQQAAQLHAIELGVGHKRIIEDDLIWVLASLRIEIHSLPRWEEQLIVETWPKGVNRLYFIRDFLIHNTQNKLLVAGTSEWLVLDRKSLRPQRATLFGDDFSHNKQKHAIESISKKRKTLENTKVCKEYTVQWSDLDINNHTNNSKYIDWISDCVVEIGLNPKDIKAIQIFFISETKKGDFIQFAYQRMEHELSVIGFKNENEQVFQSVVEFL